ncbi:hypothetical protein GCM10010404_15690 [Nonomuraea africana]
MTPPAADEIRQPPAQEEEAARAQIVITHSRLGSDRAFVVGSLEDLAELAERRPARKPMWISSPPMRLAGS